MEEIFHHLYWSFACILIVAVGLMSCYMIYKLFEAFRILFVREISYYKLKETITFDAETDKNGLITVDVIAANPEFGTVSSPSQGLRQRWTDGTYIIDISAIDFDYKNLPKTFIATQRVFKIIKIQGSLYGNIDIFFLPVDNHGVFTAEFRPGSIIKFEYIETL